MRLVLAAVLVVFVPGPVMAQTFELGVHGGVHRSGDWPLQTLELEDSGRKMTPYGGPMVGLTGAAMFGRFGIQAHVGAAAERWRVLHPVDAAPANGRMVTDAYGQAYLVGLQARWDVPMDPLLVLHLLAGPGVVQRSYSYVERRDAGMWVGIGFTSPVSDGMQIHAGLRALVTGSHQNLHMPMLGLVRSF